MARFPRRAFGDSDATKTFNQVIAGFRPGNFKAILCLTGKGWVADDEGASFGKKFPVMANCRKAAFARGKEVIDPYFIYAMPAKELAPKAKQPKGIQGAKAAVEINAWPATTSKRTKDGAVISLNDPNGYKKQGEKVDAWPTLYEKHNHYHSGHIVHEPALGRRCGAAIC